MAKFGLPGGGKRTRQPQTPVRIDRSNPLGRTITHCLPLNGDNREIVTGAQLSLGTAASTTVDQRGKSLKSAGGAACASIPLDLSPYTKASVSFWLYWDAFANDDALAMEYSSNYNASDAFIVDPNAANGTFGVYASGAAGAYQGGDIARPSAAAWHHYVLLFDRTTGTTLGTKVFVDTVLQTLTSPVGQEIPDNFANSTLYLFSRNNASLFGAGRMQNLVVRGGYLLSAAEAKAEYDNPWQIFEPRKRNIYVAAAGGVSGTIAATLAAFTSSITGTTTIVGTMAQTVAAAVSAITGSTTVTGTIAKTLENDVGNLQGSTGSTSGTIAVTAQNDTSSMSGKTTIVGTMNASTGNATSNATGTTTILGQMASTMSNFIAAMTDAVGGVVARLLSLLGVGS